MASFQQESESSEYIIRSILDEFLEEIVLPVVQSKCIFRGLDKNQDYGIIEKFGTYTCMIGFDGHGSDSYINFIRRMDLKTCMEKEDTLSTILQYEELYRRHGINSGATYVEAKIYDDRVETCSVGDSQIAIFIDDVLVYMTTPHNLKNVSEKERMSERIESGSIIVSPHGAIPETFGKNTLKARPAEYIIYENGEKLAFTQALGHLGITGIQPEKNVIYFTHGQKVRVLMGSDGLWEMMNLREDLKRDKLDDYLEDFAILSSASCLEIINLAETRWKQNWNYYYDLTRTELCTTTSFRNTDPRSRSSGYDDVLVLVCDVN
jgi:serine/threonine protein phosphatase PrpC